MPMPVSLREVKFVAPVGRRRADEIQTEGTFAARA